MHTHTHTCTHAHTHTRTQGDEAELAGTLAVIGLMVGICIGSGASFLWLL